MLEDQKDRKEGCCQSGTVTCGGTSTSVESTQEELEKLDFNEWAGMFLAICFRDFRTNSDLLQARLRSTHSSHRGGTLCKFHSCDFIEGYEMWERIKIDHSKTTCALTLTCLLREHNTCHQSSSDSGYLCQNRQKHLVINPTSFGWSSALLEPMLHLNM